MTEKEFSLTNLVQNINKYSGKRIALYGTGKNAKYVMEEMQNQDIIALIDDKFVGQYIYGKKVITLKNIFLLNIEVIIIAAKASSSKIIIKRILQYCIENKILLLDMYGNDVIELCSKVMTKEHQYFSLNKDRLKHDIQRYDSICFELMHVLIDSIFYSVEDMYAIIDGDVFADNVVFHETVVDLVDYAIKNKKKVYIISQPPYRKSIVKKILEKREIEEADIIANDSTGRGVMSGLLRESLGNDFEKNILYIGNVDSDGFYMSLIYNFDFYILKDSWTYLYQLSEMHIKQADLDGDKLSLFHEWVINKFNSPFVCDNDNSKFLFPEILEEENVSIEEKIELIDQKKYMDFLACELLEFPQYDDLEISIIIPVYNHFEYTYACLKTILMNTKQIKYEVIVADDGSSDDTCRLEQVVKGITIVKNDKNLLFLKNCNKASAWAKGKYLLFLNNDVQVLDNWLLPLKKVLDSNNDVGMVGPKFLNPDGTIQEAGGIIWKDGTAKNYGRGKAPDAIDTNYVRECDYITGAAILLRKNLWNEIGGFDERYCPAYFEDSDLAFEIRRRGKKVIYQPESRVVHFESVSNGRDERTGVNQHIALNLKKFTSKWKNELEKEHYLPADVFNARDRKNKKKTILFLSNRIPTPDKDIKSKIIMQHIQLFIKKECIVKFMPLDFKGVQPYVFELQQMGVEVLYGDDFERKSSAWIIANQNVIDYAFIYSQEAGEKIIDLIRLTKIKPCYYSFGLRQKENERDKQHLEKKYSLYYEKEKQLVRKAAWVFCFSEEIKSVMKQFGGKIIQIPLFTDKHDFNDNYIDSDAEETGKNVDMIKINYSTEMVWNKIKSILSF